jgi:type III secretory pathway component EscR
MSVHSMKHYLHLDHFHLTDLESTFDIGILVILGLVLVSPLILLLLIMGASVIINFFII